MKYEADTIEEYLQAIPPDRQAILEDFFTILKEYFPSIKGKIKYGMPTFWPVCSIASQKHHISLYINQTDLVEKYREDLGKLNVGKSCIRFKTSNQMPVNLIRTMFSEIKNKNL